MYIKTQQIDKFALYLLTNFPMSGQAAQQAGQWLDVAASRKWRWVVVGCVGVVAE